MNACPTSPATQAGLVDGLINRIIAFVVLCIRASGVSTAHTLTSRTRAQILACATGLLARAGNVTRLAARPRRDCDWRGASSPMSGVTPPSRGQSGWMVGFGPAALVAVMARRRPATLTEALSRRERTRLWPTRAAACARRQYRVTSTMGVLSPERMTVSIASDGTRRRREHEPRAPRNPAETAQAGADMVLSTGGHGGASRASCEFSTGIRNWDAGVSIAMTANARGRDHGSLH